MKTLIILLAFILSPLLQAGDESKKAAIFDTEMCFSQKPNDKDADVKIKLSANLIEGYHQIILSKVGSEEEYNQYYMCYKVKEEDFDYTCSGDDDTGSFHISKAKKKVNFQQPVLIGSPDKNLELQATEITLSECSNN